MQEPNPGGEGNLAPMSARTLNALHWSARRMAESEKRLAKWSAAVQSMRTAGDSPEPDAPIGWNEPWMFAAAAADVGREPAQWGLWADMYRAGVTS